MARAQTLWLLPNMCLDKRADSCASQMSLIWCQIWVKFGVADETLALHSFVLVLPACGAKQHTAVEDGEEHLQRRWYPQGQTIGLSWPFWFRRFSEFGRTVPLHWASLRTSGGRIRMMSWEAKEIWEQKRQHSKLDVGCSTMLLLKTEVEQRIERMM